MDYTRYSPTDGIIGKVIILDKENNTNVQFINTVEVLYYLIMIFIINSKIKEIAKLIVLIYSPVND